MFSFFNRKFTPSAWNFTHVYFPLLPFFLQGIIRFHIVAQVQPDLLNGLSESFDFSTLIITLGLSCLFISDSLKTRREPAGDIEKRNETDSWALIFLALMVACIVAFAIIVYAQVLFEKGQDPLNKTSLGYFKWAISLITLIVVHLARRVQQSYKLHLTGLTNG